MIKYQDHESIAKKLAKEMASHERKELSEHQKMVTEHKSFVKTLDKCAKGKKY
jgi:hypothetical protein